MTGAPLFDERFSAPKAGYDTPPSQKKVGAERYSEATYFICDTPGSCASRPKEKLKVRAIVDTRHREGIRHERAMIWWDDVFYGFYVGRVPLDKLALVHALVPAEQHRVARIDYDAVRMQREPVASELTAGLVWAGWPRRVDVHPIETRPPKPKGRAASTGYSDSRDDDRGYGEIFLPSSRSGSYSSGSRSGSRSGGFGFGK